MYPAISALSWWAISFLIGFAVFFCIVAAFSVWGTTRF